MLSRSLHWLRFGYIKLFLVFMYIPLFIVIAMSFTTTSSRGNIQYSYTDPQPSNYINIFKDSDFLNAMSNSIVLGFIVTPISVIIALTVIIGLIRARPIYRETALGTANISLITPDVITALSLLIWFIAAWAPLGLKSGYFSIVLAHISFCTPYALIAMYPKATKINANWELASKDLGYNSWKTILRIFLPFMKNAIIVGALFALSASFDDFIITRVIGGKVQTASTVIYSSRKGIKTWMTTFGSIVIILSIIVSGGIWLNKYFKVRGDKKNA